MPASFASELEAAYRDFLIVGGMPEAVLRWVETSDYGQVETVQAHILADYEADFAKHAPLGDVAKISWIWASAPKQLAKENNKFVFSRVKEVSAPTSSKTPCNGLLLPGSYIRLSL